jgi:[histone H3]-lysine36 N-trimethyltransferase
VYQIPIAPLPPKWRAAYDKDGLPFYYHLKKRIPQWEPPSLVPAPGSLSTSDDSSSTSETESVEETDEEDGESGSSDEEAIQDEVATKKAEDDDSDEDDELVFTP